MAYTYDSDPADAIYKSADDTPGCTCGDLARGTFGQKMDLYKLALMGESVSQRQWNTIAICPVHAKENRLVPELEEKERRKDAEAQARIEADLVTATKSAAKKQKPRQPRRSREDKLAAATTPEARAYRATARPHRHDDTPAQREAADALLAVEGKWLKERGLA